MKTSFATRLFGFFILAQFLNVQVQSAFATAAVTASDPGLAQALSDFSAKVEAHYGSKSEERQLKVAFKFYAIANKLRNKVFHKSADEIQAKIENLDQSKVDSTTLSAPDATSDDDSEITQGLASEGLQDLATASTTPITLDHSQANKEVLLQNSDPLLLDLGSTLNDDGTLTKTDFETFQANVFQLDQKADHLRSPASMSNALKVILSTLIIIIGLVVVVWIAAVFALAIGFGGITLVGGLALGLLAGGVIVGVIFAVKAISNARNESFERMTTLTV